MELWFCRETSQTFGLLTLGFVWGWQCLRCPSGNPGVQWDFRPAVCCSQSSVAWRDTGGSGVAVIPISLGSFGSRDRGTNLQEWGWSGCCSHRKEEGNRAQEAASVSVLPLIPCEDCVLPHLREGTGGSAVTFGVFFCGSLFLSFRSCQPRTACSSFQLLARPCSGAGTRCLCFLSCLFVFSSLGTSPGDAV